MVAADALSHARGVAMVALKEETQFIMSSLPITLT